MFTYKKLLFIAILLVTFFLISYYTKGDFELRDSNNAKLIVQDKYLKSPSYVSEIEYRGQGYIIASIPGEPNKQIVILKKFGNTWQEAQKVKLDCYGPDESCPAATEWVKLGNNYYLYFTQSVAGTGLGSISFNLMTLDGALYGITASGGIGRYENISISEGTEISKELLDFLEAKVSDSKDVYHPTQTDLDIENSQNAEKKWILVNPYIYEAIKNPPVESYHLEIPEYEANLFNEWSGTTEFKIENSRYKIISYFKGPVIGLSKDANKYFVLWVPVDTYEWIEHLQFINEDTIRLFERIEDKPLYDISIKNKDLKSSPSANQAQANYNSAIKIELCRAKAKDYADKIAKRDYLLAFEKA